MLRPIRHMKKIRNLLILLSILSGILYLELMCFAFIMADRLIFPEIEPGYRDDPGIFKLQSSDGAHLSAYFLEAPNSKQLLLYCHGNGEDLGHFRRFLETFQARGISVLAFDYPGYGTSTGVASERGCYASTDAAYAYAVGPLGYKPEQICLYGRSLGGGPACWLAQRYPVGRMILDGTFTSTFRIITKWRLLPWDKFNNLARLHDITCPILFIHGTNDLIVPFSHALKNYHTYQGEKKKLWVKEAGHNNLYAIADKHFRRDVFDFILNQNPTDPKEGE